MMISRGSPNAGPERLSARNVAGSDERACPVTRKRTRISPETETFLQQAPACLSGSDRTNASLPHVQLSKTAAFPCDH
jgi:hypothetical protein